MTPHFLSLCSHRMPQLVGARALHPYPFQIWLPPPGIFIPEKYVWGVFWKSFYKDIQPEIGESWGMANTFLSRPTNTKKIIYLSQQIM